MTLYQGTANREWVKRCMTATSESLLYPDSWRITSPVLIADRLHGKTSVVPEPPNKIDHLHHQVESVTNWENPGSCVHAGLTSSSKSIRAALVALDN